MPDDHTSPYPRRPRGFSGPGAYDYEPTPPQNDITRNYSTYPIIDPNEDARRDAAVVGNTYKETLAAARLQVAQFWGVVCDDSELLELTAHHLATLATVPGLAVTVQAQFHEIMRRMLETLLVSRDLNRALLASKPIEAPTKKAR